MAQGLPDRLPRKSRGAAPATPPLPDPPRRVLLASPGVPFSSEAIGRTIELATPEHAKITVLSIAKVFGTSLGIPHPGLQPTKAEWDAQRKIVNDAAKILRRKGFELRVRVARTRNPAKLIAKWGRALRMHAIVLADPERPRWRRFIEGDLAKDIERRAGIPVHPVPEPPVGGRKAG